MNQNMAYDLDWKHNAMKYFLSEMKKRRDWRLHVITGVKPPVQDGVIIEGGNIHISGEAMNRWDNEAIYYAEAYISTIQSFFDILAKAFSKNWVQGQELYFKKWIDDILPTNNSDSFVVDLHNFKDKWVKPISDIRNPTIHEKALARNVKTFFNLKWKKGEGFAIKYLNFLKDGQEIELINYLETFDTEFDKLVNQIDMNLNKAY